MVYFVMVCEGVHPIVPVGRGPSILGNWRDGQVITQIFPQPFEYVLDADYQGLPKVMYYEQPIPLMRVDVVDALGRAGVDNIQYFDAVLRESSVGKVHMDYKAYNVVGLVSCADMAASELMGTSDSDMIDVDFHSLIIDETKTNGQLLFRLAENVSAIMVHERVKQSIERARIPGFVFYGSGEWAG